MIFLCNNDLFVCNFAFNQKVNHTYFKGSCTSYIDHCVITSHAKDMVHKCNIFNDCEDNTSDHFPIMMTLGLPIPNTENEEDIGLVRNESDAQVQNDYVNWNNVTFKNAYVSNISLLSKGIVPPEDVTECTSQGCVQEYVNKYSETIVKVMHDAAKKAWESCKPKQGKRRAKHWWNPDCTNAHNRNSFWYSIWKFCGRPRDGAVYNSYKHSKHCFRKVSRDAINTAFKFNFNTCDKLFKQNRMGSFWNKISRKKILVKNSRNPKYKNRSNISLDALEEHFSEKFSYNSEKESVTVSKARQKLADKMNNCPYYNSEFTLSLYTLKKHIKSLKLGSSAGIDGITPEHVRFSVDSPIAIHLCKLLTVIIRTGTMPKDFCKGILVPILKKSSLDPSVPKNYRPIIISPVLSKLVEMHILQECSDYNFSDYQFGFFHGKGTNTAVTLAHDVAAYCNFNKSSVFMCGLDAEGAFDGIPHAVLFNKCMDIIPDTCWKLLYKWYTNITV